MEKKTLFELLSEIPKDCVEFEVLGIKMQIIDAVTQKRMLDSDSYDHHYHQCILENGTFLFTVQDGNLQTLLKVTP